MKIGIVVDQLLAGGVQLAAIEQIKELLRLGHHAKLLILMRKKYPTDYSYLVKNVPHQYLSDSYPAYARSTIKFPIFSFLSTLHLVSPYLAPTVIKQGEYDVLISWGTTTCLTTQAIFKKRGIPYVAVIHDPINYILDKVYANTSLRFVFPIIKPLATFFEGSFVKDAISSVVISNVHKNYLKKKYKVDPQIIPLGVNVKRKIPNNLGNSILSLGRWQKEKGPEFLLTLLKKIPKANLIIAGSWTDTSDLNDFKANVHKEMLEGRVEIITSYEERNLAKICKKARLFIHPHFESFGLAALEAASFGLPIIIPQKSGVTEKFTHGIHGYFPKHIETDEFKKYVVKLLANKPLARRLGKNAQRVVKKEYSWNKNVVGFIKIVKKCKIAKPTVVVLETGHSSESYLAGGDKVLEEMLTHVPKRRTISSLNYNFEIIVPWIGVKHWKESLLPINCFILPKNLFDNKQGSFYIFIAYLIRIWHSFWKLTTYKNLYMVYSSTNVLPDILPAYFLKKLKGDVFWTSKIHHLTPHPVNRPGNFIVNSFSYYVMQNISLYCLKNSCDLIFVNNPPLFQELEKLGFSTKTMRILGGGIDINEIQKQPVFRKTKQYDGVFVGRLHPTKGVFDIVPIWKLVCKRMPGAKLVVVGEGSSEIRNKLITSILKEKLENNIDILGFVPRNYLLSILKSARLFLFTDHEAGWGLAVAEAMAAGLPVVGYNLPIFGDVYKNGFLIVPKYNTDDYANKVVELLKNDRARNALGKKAVIEARGLSWEKTSKKFLNYLEELENVQKAKTISN